MVFVKENAPHIHRKDSLFRRRLDVLIALLPVVVAAFVYYPIAALRNILISVAVRELCEFVFVLIYHRIPYDGNKHSLAEHFKHAIGCYTIDNAMVPLVSGVIYALIRPVATTNPNFIYYPLIIGAIFGMVLGKLVFGGTGKNIFNPALVGRVFAKLCFGSKYANPASTTIAPNEVFTGATALDPSKFSLATKVYSINSSALLDRFLGKRNGLLGETCKIAILIGLVYLIVRHTIDWRIPARYIGTVAFRSLIVGAIIYGGNKETLSASYPFVFMAYQLLSGGLLFGAVFRATDPVTSPLTHPDRLIYAAFLGACTRVIRLFGSLPEGVAFSILMGNALTPVIGYYKWSTTKYTWKNRLVLGLVILIPTLITIWASCRRVF